MVKPPFGLENSHEPDQSGRQLLVSLPPEHLNLAKVTHQYEASLPISQDRIVLVPCHELCLITSVCRGLLDIREPVRVETVDNHHIRLKFFK